MERVTLHTPAMYADHHVLKVREALYALEGVEDVLASSAWHSVIVSYDENRTNSAAIELALDKAGYGLDKRTPILAQTEDQFKDPAWEVLDVRVTQTNQMDLQMSGEFRRY